MFLLLSRSLALSSLLLLSLIFATAARFSTNGETGISASTRGLLARILTSPLVPSPPSSPARSSFTISWFRFRSASSLSLSLSLSSSRGSLLSFYRLGERHRHQRYARNPGTSRIGIPMKKRIRASSKKLLAIVEDAMLRKRDDALVRARSCLPDN